MKYKFIFFSFLLLFFITFSSCTRYVCENGEPCKSVSVDKKFQEPDTKTSLFMSSPKNTAIKFISFFLLLAALFWIHRKNKKIEESEEEILDLKANLEILNDKIDNFNKLSESGKIDNFIIIQIIDLIQNINSYKKNISTASLDYFNSVEYELFSILNNSGIKEYIPEIGSSVLKDTELEDCFLDRIN